MRGIPYLIFAVVFLIGYLVREFGVPSVLTWLPEGISAILLVFLLLRFAATKTLNLSIKYIVSFSVFLAIIIVGILLNDVTEGPIIAGLRYYLKFFPFFLLPAIFEFSNKQIQSQIAFLIFLGLLQLPLTFYQRFIQYYGHTTGDYISGTVGVTSTLSIVLISYILIILAFYIRKRITAPIALILTILLFIPCTLNETKGTVIFLIVGIIPIVVFGMGKRFEFKKVVVLFSAISLLLISFSAAYTTLYSQVDSAGGFFSFFSEGGAESYLYQDVEFDPEILDRHRENKTIAASNAEAWERMPRMDRLIAPFAILNTRPLNLAFGLGIGNVSDFKFKDYRGEYAYLNNLYNVESLTLSQTLWELGVLGAFAFFVFIYLIFEDARALSKEDGLIGSFAAGWLGVLAVFSVSLIYLNALQFSVIGFLFFYFSGYIAAENFKAKNLSRQNHNTAWKIANQKVLAN